MPDLPVGLNLGRNLNLLGGSCLTALRFDITRVADNFPAAP